MKKMTEKGRIEGIGFRVFWQTGSIVLLAAILAFMVNQIRSDRLPLVADFSPEARMAPESGESMLISFEEAMELCLSKKAIFLDARSRELYEQAHILYARNLSWEAVDEYFDAVMADIPRDALIITYCDGETCTQSKDLALELFYRGYENVRVLVNGWSKWVEAGLPTEKGLKGYSGSQKED